MPLRHLRFPDSIEQQTNRSAIETILHGVKKRLERAFFIPSISIQRDHILPRITKGSFQVRNQISSASGQRPLVAYRRSRPLYAPPAFGAVCSKRDAKDTRSRPTPSRSARGDTIPTFRYPCT